MHLLTSNLRPRFCFCKNKKKILSSHVSLLVMVRVTYGATNCDEYVSHALQQCSLQNSKYESLVIHLYRAFIYVKDDTALWNSREYIIPIGFISIHSTFCFLSCKRLFYSVQYFVSYYSIGMKFILQTCMCHCVECLAKIKINYIYSS